MKPLFQRHQCGSAFMHGATPTDRPGWRPKNFPVLQRRCFGPGGNKFTFRIKGFDSVNDLIGIRQIEKHFLGMWSKNVYNAAERAKSAIISSKSSNTLHRTLNFTPSLHQMKKTSDVVFKFLTNRKK
jgi:hypothetical protein